MMKHKNVRMIKGDIMDAGALAAAMAGTQYIIHSAAVVGVQRVIGNSRKTIDINFSGTSSVLNTAAGLKTLKRFVYFSTSEVFGVNAYQVDEEASTRDWYKKYLLRDCRI
jgi:UDP-glucose 4-epimerase